MKTEFVDFVQLRREMTPAAYQKQSMNFKYTNILATR